LSYEHLDLILRATDDTVLWADHTARMTAFGFDRVVYRARQGAAFDGLRDSHDWTVLSNHPKEFTDALIAGDLLFDNQMVRRCVDAGGVCGWSLSDLSQGDDTALPDLMRTWNLQHGYTICFAVPDVRGFAVVDLAADPGLSRADVDAIWAAHGDQVVLTNMVFNLKRMTLRFSDAPALTARQTEVLQWVGYGKTVQDIAILLGVTSATVDKHLRLARDSLHAETTAQAIYRASFYNLLT